MEAKGFFTQEFEKECDGEVRKIIEDAEKYGVSEETFMRDKKRKELEELKELMMKKKCKELEEVARRSKANWQIFLNSGTNELEQQYLLPNPQGREVLKYLGFN